MRSEGDAFLGIQGFHYWSSTSVAHDRSHAWRVTITYGEVEHGDKTNNYYVWPVRGGQ